MQTSRVRFIGGFGDIHWINEDDWRLTTPKWASGEADMIENMNQDHVDAMQAICAFYTNTQVNDVRMLAINPDGAFYKCDDRKPIFINFEVNAFEPIEVRKSIRLGKNFA